MNDGPDLELLTKDDWSRIFDAYAMFVDFRSRVIEERLARVGEPER